MAHLVRPLEPAEHRGAHGLFRRALHRPPLSDEGWAPLAGSFPGLAAFGAFEDGPGGALVGMAMSWASQLVVPGGARVPMAAVSRVGVRADRTRRGVLTALMRAQLADLAGRGVVAATLRASEGVIYERFGYGVATRGQELRLDRLRVRLRPGVPEVGAVRLLYAEDLPGVLPGVHERFGVARPGAVVRWAPWWEMLPTRAAPEEVLVAAVHSDGSGVDDGYVLYDVVPRSDSDHGARLRVWGLVGASPAVEAALWRYVLGVDLVDEVVAHLRPLDDLVGGLLVDPRGCSVAGVSDETWLRLVDVAGALRARSWGAGEPVVVGVRDEVLPGNAGCYRVGSGVVARVSGPAEVELDSSALAAAYLGDVSLGALAAAGRVVERAPGAAARAAALFSTGVVPWSGTYF